MSDTDGPKAKDRLAAVVLRELVALNVVDQENVLQMPLAELGLDSFAVVALLVALEEASGTTMADDLVENAQCLQDLIDHV